MLRRLILTVLLVIVAAPALATSPDHPLLARYPDATVTNYQQIDYERFALPNGLPAQGASVDFPVEDLVGDLTRHTYRVRGVSTLKLYESYKSAIDQAGMKVLFECALEDCGNQRQVQALGAQLATASNVLNFWRSPYYILAQGGPEGRRTHIALFIGGNEGDAAIQQVVLEDVQIASGLVSIDEEYLNRPPASSPDDIQAEQLTEAERARDHPLLSRFPGARIRERTHKEYERFAMPLSPVTAFRNVDNFEQAELTGDLTKHFYIRDQVSSLLVYENYKAALDSADFEILFECALGECGNSTDTRALGALVSTTGNVFNYHRNPYYIVARRNTIEGYAYIALFIGSYKEDTAIQQVVVETREADLDLVEVNSDLLQRELDESGRVSIYGIQFATNSADIKPESKPALDTLAELLEEQAYLQLYVVGHTDDTGPVEHNQKLSAERAQAVVEHLVREYGVRPSRLHSAGAGPFSPASTNSTEEGRALNRRVELVRRLQ